MDSPHSMGPELKQWTPPFTPTGRSSYWSQDFSAFAGIRGAHWGILARFRADAAYLGRLLPAPLEPAPNTGEVFLFINETLAIAEQERLADAAPAERRFREAILIFPCRYEGVECRYHYIMYTDSDWNVYIANLLGLWTKLADIDLLFPYPPNPSFDPFGGDGELRGSVARLGERIMSVSFRPRERVDPAATFASGWRTPLLGMRYFPDISTQAKGRPLVHDLVRYDMDERVVAEAWRGEAEVAFGDSAREELAPFAPLEMRESYYMSGYSYLMRGPRALHDYVRGERVGALEG